MLYLCPAFKHAPIAQLDRASDYGSEGWAFESLWVYSFLQLVSVGQTRVYRCLSFCRLQAQPNVPRFRYFCSLLNIAHTVLKKIDWLLVRSFLGPFVLTFCIALFVLIMQFLWKYIDDLVGKGLDTFILAELIFYLSASVVPLALPIAILLSSIMTFGSLGEHYELIALKAAGISLFRFMLPLLIVATMLTGGAFLFANYVLPVANLKFSTLLYSVTKKRPALNIRPGVYYNGIEGYIIRVASKEENSRFMNEVQIYDHTENRGNVRILLAERGEMFTTSDEKYMVFRLFDGVQYEEPRANTAGAKASREFIRTHFKEYEMMFDLSQFDYATANESLFKNNQRMFSVRQLFNVADSIRDGTLDQRERYERNLAPYYSFFQDTTLLTKAKNLPTTTQALPAATDSLTRSLAFLNQLPLSTLEEKTALLDRAVNMARGVKSVNPAAANTVEADNKKINKYLIEAHIRITLSLACLVLFLIGAPLGAIIRRGGVGLPMVMAILFFIVFHILSTTGRKFAEEQVLSPFMGMWMSIFVLTPIGIFLTYKAMNDSALLNLEAYGQFFKRLRRRLSRNKE